MRTPAFTYCSSFSSRHLPVLAVYCRLPLFLYGDRGLFFTPVVPAVVPEGKLEDIFPVPVVQLGLDATRSAEWVVEDGELKSYTAWKKENREERGQTGEGGDVAQMLGARGRLTAVSSGVRLCARVHAVRLWKRDFQSEWSRASIPLH